MMTCHLLNLSLLLLLFVYRSACGFAMRVLLLQLLLSLLVDDGGVAAFELAQMHPGAVLLETSLYLLELFFAFLGDGLPEELLRVQFTLLLILVSTSGSRSSFFRKPFLSVGLWLVVMVMMVMMVMSRWFRGPCVEGLGPDWLR